MVDTKYIISAHVQGFICGGGGGGGGGRLMVVQ